MITDEERELLEQDILGRIPWMNIEVEYNGGRYPVFGYGAGRLELLAHKFASFTLPVAPLVQEVRPVLRHLSSMTEKEKKELEGLTGCDKITVESIGAEGGEFPYSTMRVVIDWFNKKGFDYRGLIDLGLAVKS